MPGNRASGNRTAQRGHRTRTRRKISKRSALTLRLLAWGRAGRPTTDEEEDAILDALIEEERQRITPLITDEQREEARQWAERVSEEEEEDET